jgi:hypothetical protein
MSRFLAALIAAAACDGCGAEEQVDAIIAECASAQGEVRAHPSDEWVWSPVSAGDRFASGAWVRTGVESRARIRFTSGDELGLDPSSTVVLEPPERAPSEGGDLLVSRVKVETGVVRSIVGERSRMVVRTPEGKPLRIDPSEPGKRVEVRVKVGKEGRVEVAVTEGRANVSAAEGAAVSIERGQAQDVLGGALVGGAVALPPAPEAKAIERTVEVGDRARLAWAPAPGAVRYRVQVASDPGFGTIQQDIATAGTESVFVPKSAGTFYYRVAAVEAGDREGEFSEVMTISVVERVPDLLSTPLDGHTIKYVTKDPIVVLSWREGQAPSRYRVVVSRKPDLSDPILDEETDALELSTRALATGTYYWGVYLAQDSPKALFRKPRRLHLEKTVGLRTPRKVTFR